MKLIKYDNFWNDPFADLDNLVSRFFSGSSNAPWSYRYGLDRDVARSFRLDSYADDDAYYVVAELPGIPKEAIDVRLENAVLSISGELKTGEKDNQRTTTFRRSVTLGDDVNAEKVSASYENGLLTVTLPKAEERKPRSITVG